MRTVTRDAAPAAVSDLLMALRRALPPVVLVLAAATLLGAGLQPASARRVHVAAGLGDQNPAMFGDAHFARLRVRKARYFVRWDVMRLPAQRARLDAWLFAAGLAGVRPLVHVSTNDLRPGHAHLPSTGAYRRQVGRLVRHLRRRGVRDVGVWNEANHRSQPTFRSPARAAGYYRTMRRLCRGCTIVGLDVLDQAGVDRYIRRFFAALPRSLRHRRIVVGIHNYSDTNRRRSRGTRTIIRAVRSRDRHARFWLTETGGVVNFGRSFPCSPRRAAARTAWMFSLARRYDRYVERLYAYNFYGSGCRGFDAGLVSAHGRARPGYWAFRAGLMSFER